MPLCPDQPLPAAVSLTAPRDLAPASPRTPRGSSAWRARGTASSPGALRTNELDEDKAVVLLGLSGSDQGSLERLGIFAFVIHDPVPLGGTLGLGCLQALDTAQDITIHRATPSRERGTPVMIISALGFRARSRSASASVDATKILPCPRDLAPSKRA